MNPVANQNKIETYIKCKKCGTEVSSITNGNLTPCNCGAISVDGSKDLVRVLGNPEDYEEIKKNNMITVIFEAHGTTFDNEAHLSSGHNDVELSPLGIQQSKEMGERYKDDYFDAIFCSDLQRAYKSAEIGFGNKWPIIQDARLRECDYGDLTQHPSSEVDVEKPKRIHTPFPNGESYEQTTARMKAFLEDLLKNYGGKRIMVIGHRATQYGLDHLIKGVSLEQLTSSHFKWQPGWEYNFENI